MALYLRHYLSCMPPLSRVSEHVMVIPAGARYLLHNLDFKMIVILQGAIRMSIDQQEQYALAAGDAVILPTVCEQHYYGEDERQPTHLHVLALRFALDGDDGFSRFYREAFPRVRHLKAASCVELRPWIDKLHQAIGWKQVDAAAMTEVARLLVLQAAHASGGYPLPALPPPWREAEEAHLEIVRKPSAPLPAASAHLGIWLGCSPVKYRSLQRIERAKEVMTHQMLPLSAFSRQMGYDTLSSFSHAFRRATGYSPREYRERLHDDGPEVESFLGDVRVMDSAPVRLLHPGEAGRVAKPSLIVALEGLAELRRGSVEESLSGEGQELLYLSAGSRWKVRGARVAVVSFSEGDEIAAAFGKGIERIVLRERRLVELLRCHLRRLSEGSGEAGEYDQLFADALFRLIAVELLQGIWSRSQALAGSTREVYRLPVDYAKEYLRKHLGGSIRLADVAWFSGVSEEHLARSFKRSCGMSVMSYLKELRLAQAKLRLADSALSVTEIASACGFSTTALFCREFRKALGCTPSAYRAKAGGGQG